MKAKQWWQKIRTDHNPGLVKKQILNLTWLILISWALMLCGIILFMAAKKKNNLPLNIISHCIISFGIIGYVGSWIITACLYTNKEFIKQPYRWKFLLLPLMVFRGFWYVDQITKLEISNNYVFAAKEGKNFIKIAKKNHEN